MQSLWTGELFLSWHYTVQMLFSWCGKCYISYNQSKARLFTWWPNLLTYWLLMKFVAATITSSSVWTMTGTLLQPGDFRRRSSTLRVRSTTVGKQTSVLFTITNVGTFSAMAKPRCSFVVPTSEHKKNNIKNFIMTKQTNYRNHVSYHYLYHQRPC